MNMESIKELPTDNEKERGGSWFDSWKVYSLMSYLALTSTACKPKPEETKAPEKTDKTVEVHEAPINEAIGAFDKIKQQYESGELKIPAVHSIEFHRPERFNKTLFYIRTHHLPFISEEQFKNEPKEKHITYLETCRQSGEEVSNVLDILHEKTGVDQIHLEGVTDNNHKNFLSNWKDELTADRTVARLAGRRIDETHNTGSKIPKPLLDKYRIAIPEGVASNKPWAKLLPGETEPESKSAMDAAAIRMNRALAEHKTPDKEDMDLIYEVRESGVLKTIKDSKAVLIMGGAHYLTDNVENYNKDNPDNAFALITITPQSLKKQGYVNAPQK